MSLVQHFSQFLLSAQFTLGFIAASFIGVVLVMTHTSPIEVGPGGMLAAFGIFYIWFLALLLGLAHVFRAVAGRNAAPEEKHRTISSRAVMVAASWAFAPLIMLALQSIGQLDLISLGLVVIFEVLAMVYILRR